MPRYCSILTCENFKGRSNFEDISFFRQPFDRGVRDRWIQEIKKHQKIDLNFVVCQLHFEPKHLRIHNQSTKARLKPNAIPTIFKKSPIEQPEFKNVIVEEEHHVETPTIQWHPKVEPSDSASIPKQVTHLPTPVNGFSGVGKIVKLKPVVVSRPQAITRLQPTQSCFKCIQSSVHIEMQKVRIQNQRQQIEELQSINKERLKRIHELEAKIYKSKQRDNENLKKCSVCRKTYFATDINHICNGETEICCVYCEQPLASTSDLLNHLSIYHNEKTFFKCNKCPSVYPMALLLEFHSRCHSHHAEPRLTCDICDAKCHTRHEIREHMEQNHVDTPRNQPETAHFQCGTCGITCADAPKLKSHMTKKHDKISIGQFECFLCKLQFKSLYDTRQHLKSHERNEKCTICNAKCTPTELQEHMCDGLESIKCEYCSEPFKNMTSLLQHLESCKGEVLMHRCEKCRKFFKMELLRDYHLKQHEEQSKSFVCDICPKKFATKVLMKSHQKRHERAHDHLCDQCGKGFQTFGNLKKHQRNHQLEKPFKCPNCDLRFSKREYLKRHSLCHTNLKFLCSTCGAKLISQKGLAVHMRNHTLTEADRKHVCTICSLKFFRLDALKRHMTSTHTDEKRFECEFCGQTYKYNGDLNKHKRTHLGDDMYKCPSCPKRFRIPYELQRHSYEHYEEQKMETC